MKKTRIVQVTLTIIIVGSFIGLTVGTDVYKLVKENIVETLCLSCLKLEFKTNSSFTFDTANGEPNPDFIVGNLTSGVIFLHFSEDACPGCDIMLPVIQNLFSIQFEKKDMVYETLDYENATVHYYYTNIDHATKERIDLFPIYDKEHKFGLPMFAIITLGNDEGEIKPYYATLYGTLDLQTNQQRTQFLQEMMAESIQLWDENT